MTSYRSPGHFRGMAVPLTTGNEDAIPILVADVLKFAEVRSAGEIEDDVEPAELTKGEVNELRTLHRIVKQAGLQRHHRATRTVNERGCLFGVLDADVTANDCGTLAREGQCSCSTDAPAGSGHEADLPG
jgi:hypothetical protein